MARTPRTDCALNATAEHAEHSCAHDKSLTRTVRFLVLGPRSSGTVLRISSMMGVDAAADFPTFRII